MGRWENVQDIWDTEELGTSNIRETVYHVVYFQVVYC